MFSAEGLAWQPMVAPARASAVVDHVVSTCCDLVMIGLQCDKLLNCGAARAPAQFDSSCRQPQQLLACMVIVLEVAAVTPGGLQVRVCGELVYTE